MPERDLPPWLQPPDDLDARRDEVARVGQRLARAEGPLWLVGPPGSGVSAVAAAVALDFDGPVRAVRLTACRTPADVLVAIGEAVGAVPPGAEGAVSAALRSLGHALVLVDDADIPDRGKVLEQLGALAPESTVLCTGRRAPADAPTETLAPISGVSPPGLPEGLALPAKAELLAVVGCSLPGAMGMPYELVIRTSPGREALRRSVAEAIRSRGQLEPARVAANALPDLEPLLAQATGASLPGGWRSDDAFALRWMGEVLSDPDASCRASAAAARLFAALGQPGPALAVLDAADRRNPRAAPAARALVSWARGDIRLAGGELDAAESAWGQAAELLERARDLVLLATLTRRQADALAARGLSRRAARRYRTARSLHLQVEDPAGVAATVRGTADLAVAAGEILSAEMLYDEAQRTAAGIVETSNRRLGRAGLALSQGDLRRARHLLENPEFETVSLPLLAANRQRRRAELALREGRHDDATAAARAAADAYARLGEGVAHGRTLRLLGDIAAAAGRLAEAAADWQRALELQVRSRDLAGLQRTLEHAATMEEEYGSAVVAQAMRDALDTLAAGAERTSSATLTGRAPVSEPDTLHDERTGGALP